MFSNVGCQAGDRFAPCGSACEIDTVNSHTLNVACWLYLIQAFPVYWLCVFVSSTSMPQCAVLEYMTFAYMPIFVDIIESLF